MGSLTPVPETAEEEEPEFIFTITNSRGQLAGDPTTPVRGGNATGAGSGSGIRPAIKLSDAQRVGLDAPPSYDQVITETRLNN